MDAGVEERRSMYDRKESRLHTLFFGEGGCEVSEFGMTMVVAAGGRLCSGCSWCVAVVGEDVSDPASDEGAVVEVGVWAAIVDRGGGAAVCTVGREGGDPCEGGEPCRGLALNNKLLLFPAPVGLGLRLLMREIGLVKPLW